MYPVVPSKLTRLNNCTILHLDIVCRQQLDDISFNLSKIDVFGRHLKHAALSKCFRAEFDKQPFALRKKMNVFLKGGYFLNLCVLIFGIGLITVKQNKGDFHSDSITVMFGEQVWRNAIVTTSTGEEETRTLLFSYFNGKESLHHIPLKQAVTQYLLTMIFPHTFAGVYFRNGT